MKMKHNTMWIVEVWRNGADTGDIVDSGSDCGFKSLERARIAARMYESEYPGATCRIARLDADYPVDFCIKDGLPSGINRTRIYEEDN